MNIGGVQHDTSRKAFTLMELLVVMGIVAVLGVLSTAAIQSGLERGRSAACIGNLTRIYTALQQYAGDHSGFLPVMLPLRGSSGDPGPTLDTELGDYLPDPSVFHCPADHSVFLQSGSSYLWVYGMSVDSQGQQNQSMLAPSFPLLQTASTSLIPFVSDKESFHRGTPGAHIVYADGHVQ